APVCGPRRRSGEGAGVSGGAGRDRGGSQRGRGSEGERGGGAGGGGARRAGDLLRGGGGGAGGEQQGVAGAAEPAVAGLYVAVGVRGAGAIAADGQRQARPQGPA